MGAESSERPMSVLSLRCRVEMEVHLGCLAQLVDWEFTLFLNHPVASKAEIDWSAHLPPENVTRWLALDPSSKRIQIEPSAAVPDLA